MRSLKLGYSTYPITRCAPTCVGILKQAVLVVECYIEGHRHHKGGERIEGGSANQDRHTLQALDFQQLYRRGLIVVLSCS